MSGIREASLVGDNLDFPRSVPGWVNPTFSPLLESMTTDWKQCTGAVKLNLVQARLPQPAGHMQFICRPDLAYTSSWERGSPEIFVRADLYGRARGHAQSNAGPVQFNCRPCAVKCSFVVNSCTSRVDPYQLKGNAYPFKVG